MVNDVIKRLVNLAFVSTVVGVCTIGICPAFGVIGIVIGAVIKAKGMELDDLCAKKIKYSFILGVVSLVFFVVDIVVLLVIFK